MSILEGNVTLSNPLGHEIDGGLTHGVYYQYSLGVSPEQILWENLSVTGPDLSGLYSVGATLKIVNAGSVKSPGGSLTLYKSTDNVLDAADTPVDEMTVPTVEVGASTTRGGFFKTAFRPIPMRFTGSPSWRRRRERPFLSLRRFKAA